MRKSFAAAVLAGSILTATPALADAPKGGRVEALIGADRISVDLGGGNGTYSKSGFTYGGAAGYDVPVGHNLSVGADAEIDGATTRIRSGSARVEAGRDLYVGGRVTANVAPATNVYVKAGYANARLIARSGSYSYGENGNGVRVGVGLQQQFMSNLYGVVEYRYTNYQDDVSRNQVVAGVGLRF